MLTRTAGPTRRATLSMISTWRYSSRIDWSWPPERNRDGRIVAKSILRILLTNLGYCPGQTWNYRVVTEAFRKRGAPMPKVCLKTLSVHLRANLLASGQFITAFPNSVVEFYGDRFGLKVLPIDLPNCTRGLCRHDVETPDLVARRHRVHRLCPSSHQTARQTQPELTILGPANIVPGGLEANSQPQHEMVADVADGPIGNIAGPGLRVAIRPGPRNELVNDLLPAWSLQQHAGAA